MARTRIVSVFTCTKLRSYLGKALFCVLLVCCAWVSLLLTEWRPSLRGTTQTTKKSDCLSHLLSQSRYFQVHGKALNIPTYPCDCLYEERISIVGQRWGKVNEGYIPIHERLSLLLTMYPEGHKQVPPSGEAWQRCSQLREAHFQIPETRNQNSGCL